MNASPAMEAGGPLICFGATVTRSAVGERIVRSDRGLFTGPGATSAGSDELLVSVDVPAPSVGPGSVYVRLEYRRQMEIAVVGVTAVVTLEAVVIADARVAITALAPTIHRVPTAEGLLVGSDGGRAASKPRPGGGGRGFAPISDVRGSAAYRRPWRRSSLRERSTVRSRGRRGRSVPIPASAGSTMTGAHEDRRHARRERHRLPGRDSIRTSRCSGPCVT